MQRLGNDDLDDKFEFSIRTFDRDKKDILDLFGIPIQYSRKDKVYYIDEEIQIYTKLLTFHLNYKFYNFEDGLKSNHSLLCEFSELDGVKMSKSLVFDFKIYALSYVNVENWGKAIIYYKEILKLKPVNKFSKEQLFLCSLKLENGN
jgi:hypothetical protein